MTPFRTTLKGFDDSPAARTVEIPADFAKAMHASERRAFDAMPYSHRKEYVVWIEAAKKPQTRLRRIEKACSALRERISSSVSS
jgi:uncharacterized protein YdeI (YjbR/CyaY-like superfamily)